MSITLCQTTAAPVCPPTDTGFAPTKNTFKHDVWTMIQSEKSPSNAATDALPTYVHPLVHRSSILMSNSSLHMCTESLGSETGSSDFSGDGHGLPKYSSEIYEIVENHKALQSKSGLEEVKQRPSVKYHRSAISQSVTHSFPPPLPSLSSHDGTCIQMRTCRQVGRVVVEAVPVALQNCLHARRHDGRLLLAFVHSPSANNNLTETKVHINGIEKVTPEPHVPEEQHLPAEMVGEPKEIEHYLREANYEKGEEVIDRRSIGDVKVSMHLQQGGSANKDFDSSLVAGAPLTNQNRWAEPIDDSCHHNDASWSQQSLPRQHQMASDTTAVAASLAASSGSASPEPTGQYLISIDNKILYTSNRRNSDEMVSKMKRCSELRRPLFWEAGCTVSSRGCISS